jgi:hypothetical protein
MVDTRELSNILLFAYLKHFSSSSSRDSVGLGLGERNEETHTTTDFHQTNWYILHMYIPARVVESKSLLHFKVSSSELHPR